MSEQQVVQVAVEANPPVQNVQDQPQESHQAAAASGSRPHYRGNNNRGGYFRGGRGGGRFPNRGGRFAPRGSGRGAGPSQPGKRWVPKGQASENKQQDDQDQNKESSHHHHHHHHHHHQQQQHRGQQGGYQRKQHYGGKDGQYSKPQYKKKGEDYDKPREKNSNQEQQFQNYWRYYNEQRKQPTNLVKKQDMKWDTELPELPKNKPKAPEDEEYDKRKQLIQTQIQEAIEKIQSAQKVRVGIKQGHKIQTQNKTDSKQMKETKSQINKLSVQKQKLHKKQKQLKNELIHIKNKLADLHQAKDKLPKQIQKYWIYSDAEERKNKILHEIQTGNLGKFQEDKLVNELQLLQKHLPQLKKIKSAPQEIKKQIELRNQQKAVLEENWKKIKQLADSIESNYNKLNQMYEKQDKKDDKPKQEDQMEKINEQIQGLRNKKYELVQKKRKVDDDYYGDWINYQNEQIYYDSLSRLHKVKAAINRRKQYTEQQEKNIMEKVIENPYQDEIDTCDSLITLLQQEIYMNKATLGNEETKTSEQTRAPILAPKGTTQAKSKGQRMQDFELLQPTKLPGGKNKKKNKKQQIVSTGASSQSSIKKREYNLLVQFGKLDIEKPQNPQEYKEKLAQVKERRDSLISKGQNQVKLIREKQISIFRQKREEQDKQRERGEFVPNKSRGGRGGKFRDNKGRGDRGSYGRGQYNKRNDDNDDEFGENDQQEKESRGRGYGRGGYGRGGKKKRYDDEDEEEDDYGHKKPQFKEFKEYAAPEEGGEWPQLK